MITIIPERIPEEPSPAIARPKMKAFELGLAPHMAEPTSKRVQARRKTTLALKSLYTLPINKLKLHVVKRYADPYHPMSEIESKSSVIRGMAVEMIFWS